MASLALCMFDPSALGPRLISQMLHGQMRLSTMAQSLTPMGFVAQTQGGRGSTPRPYAHAKGSGLAGGYKPGRVRRGNERCVAGEYSPAACGQAALLRAPRGILQRVFKHTGRQGLSDFNQYLTWNIFHAPISWCVLQRQK